MKIDPKCIGGSSVASCVGVGWESQIALWERLRGDTSRADSWTREQRRMLAAGHALEPVATDAVRDDYGVEIVRPPELMEVADKHEPRLVGHPDGWIVPGEIGAEIKTTSGRRSSWGDEDTDHVPAGYLAQCLFYMALTGAREWHLFAMRVPVWSVTRYIIRRDETMCRQLLDSANAMLRLVDEGTMPDPADEAEARERWFAHVPGKVAVVTDGRVLEAITRRAIASRVASIAKKISEQTSFEILTAAEDAETVTDASGTPLLTLRANRVFDVAAFAEKHAGAYADCFAFDKAVARDRYKKLYDACMRDPVKGESSRTIRLSKQLQAAVDKMLTGERASIPFVPEFSKLTEDTDG